MNNFSPSQQNANYVCKYKYQFIYFDDVSSFLFLCMCPLYYHDSNNNFEKEENNINA